MRHRVSQRKLGLPSDQRQALLRGLVRSLVDKSSILTTETRAKEVRVLAEKLVTLTKAKDVHSRRMARRLLNDETLVKRLFDEIGPRFASRPGGYTRMVKLGFRRGDAAPMVKLEFVEAD